VEELCRQKGNKRNVWAYLVKGAEVLTVAVLMQLGTQAVMGHTPGSLPCIPASGSALLSCGQLKKSRRVCCYAVVDTSRDGPHCTVTPVHASGLKSRRVCCSAVVDTSRDGPHCRVTPVHPLVCKRPQEVTACLLLCSYVQKS
jgi:hypothetical protein